MIAKLCLEFNLPEDDDAYRTTMNAVNYRMALSEVIGLLRSKKKYADLTEDQHALVTELYEACCSIVSDNEVEV
jgi:hypothetical protein